MVNQYTPVRKVNKHLIYTPRPIPPTQSILSELSKKSLFSAIDISKAYQQLPLKGDKIGIITEFGVFRFTRLPYGLASAPYWWGEFIQTIINKVNVKSTSVIRYYYDDIVIASNDATEHFAVIHSLFEQLDLHGLTVSESKLQLSQTTIHFLGYNISKDRLAIDDEKIKTIQNWKLPTDKEGIVKFIGFVN